MSYATARKKAAQKRAADKLIAAYPDEYARLLDVEMAAEGYERREVVTDEWIPKPSTGFADVFPMQSTPRATVKSHVFRAIDPHVLRARVV